MAKESEKRIREAFATWLRADTALVTLAGAATNIRADNANAQYPVPGVVFNVNTAPFTNAPGVFESYMSIVVCHTLKDQMLDMLGAIKELANPRSNQRDAAFSNAYVATVGIAWLNSAEVEATARGAATGQPLESVFQGEAIVRVLWRDLS